MYFGPVRCKERSRDHSRKGVCPRRLGSEPPQLQSLFWQLRVFTLRMQIFLHHLAPVPENTEFTNVSGVTKNKSWEERLSFQRVPSPTGDYLRVPESNRQNRP